jgi:hypothetical protein
MEIRLGQIGNGPYPMEVTVNDVSIIPNKMIGEIGIIAKEGETDNQKGTNHPWDS